MKEVITIEDYFETLANTLVVLSIFLIISIELTGPDKSLGNVLALISSAISYLLFLSIIGSHSKKRTTTLFLLEITLLLFVPIFCIWTLLNAPISLNSFNINLAGLILIILMALPFVKYFRSLKRS